MGPEESETIAGGLVAPVTVSFQDGVSPSASYAGTQDTTLVEETPAQTYGSDGAIRTDGDSPAESRRDVSGLVRWDLSAIPSGSTVQSASLTFNVNNPAGGSYGLYALGRAWSEAEAQWTSASIGAPWEVAGARGPGDRDGRALGTVTEASTRWC